jgi:hypothetical protein
MQNAKRSGAAAQCLPEWRTWNNVCRSTPHPPARTASSRAPELVVVFAANNQAVINGKIDSGANARCSTGIYFMISTLGMYVLPLMSIRTRSPSSAA